MFFYALIIFSHALKYIYFDVLINTLTHVKNSYYGLLFWPEALLWNKKNLMNGFASYKRSFSLC